MTPSLQIPRLAMFAREKWRRLDVQVREIAAYSFEHALFIGGHAGMAYGAWMIWHPLGPLVGGWFAVKIALIISSRT